MASKTVIRFSALLSNKPPPLSNKRPLQMCFANKRPHSNIIWEYGYVSTEVHLHLMAHKRTVFPLYKNSGLMSMWVHKVFKRMISFSNFVAIARLVVLARKDPGTTTPFSSLLDPLPWLPRCAHYELFLRKVNIRKESSIRKCPTSFKVSPSR